MAPGNYDFRLIGEVEVKGRRCYALELLARRKDKNLVRGVVWVDSETYLLHRMEGEPAKTPSWWLKNVHEPSVSACCGYLAPYGLAATGSMALPDQVIGIEEL
jgi:hypothetical protein